MALWLTVGAVEDPWGSQQWSQLEGGKTRVDPVAMEGLDMDDTKPLLGVTLVTEKIIVLLSMAAVTFVFGMVPLKLFSVVRDNTDIAARIRWDRNAPVSCAVIFQFVIQKGNSFKAVWIVYSERLLNYIDSALEWWNLRETCWEENNFTGIIAALPLFKKLFSKFLLQEVLILWLESFCF